MRRSAPPAARVCARVARGAPWMTVDKAAQTAGVKAKAIHKALASLPLRSGCATTAAKLADNGSLDICLRQRALAHRAAAPPTLRAATRHVHRPTLTSAGLGSAAWAGRRERAQMTRSQMALVSGFSEEGLRRQTTSSPACPAAMLRRLAADDVNTIRVDVAAHAHSPPDALAVLSTDAHGRVRVAAANNPNTPPSLLVVLASDSSAAARRGVANNPSTPPGTVAG